MVTYHPGLPKLHQILRRHLPILHASERMKQVMPNPPLVAYRRPKNLKDLLVRATLNPPERNFEGTRQCGRPRCKTCAHIKVGVVFSSAVTGVEFRARTTADCKTSNVVYLIECRKCKKQYVGETENPLHLRLNGHRSDYYRRLPDKPVGMHFNTSGHTFDDLTIMIIEQMRVANATHRKNRESFWIHTLRSSTPHGLNIES